MRISDWSSDVCSSDLLVAAKAAITGFLRQRGAELTRGAVGNDRRRDRSKIGLETGAEGSAGRCLQVRKTGAIERPIADIAVIVLRSIELDLLILTRHLQRNRAEIKIGRENV